MTENEIKHSIVVVRGIPVIMARELASFFETTVSAVNQYRKRNAEKFTEDYAFQLSSDEWKKLKSQNVISNKGRGGSRHLPWAYTDMALQ